MSVLSSAFSNLPGEHIPKFVVFDLMYRDGGNWKTTERYAFENDNQLTLDQISEWLENYMPTEEILASRYDLPNLAPLDSEYDIGNEDDHCYMELSELDVCDTLNNMDNKDDTPFSQIYQKAINIAQPGGFKDELLSDQKLVLARLESDISSLTQVLSSVDVDNLKARLSTSAGTLAAFCNQKVVPKNARILHDGDKVIPSFMDSSMLVDILYSALTNTKARRDLNTHFGESKVADFHAQLLRIAPTLKSE